MTLTAPRALTEGALQFTTLDAHTEGEPLRIITSGYPEIPGDSILAKRRYLTEHLDQYRRLLMHEPRGHSDMYGALITEPVTADGDFGVLFLHNEGYSSMCGHAILALAQVTAQCRDAQTPIELKIDAPAGRVTAYCQPGEKGWEASFDNVPAFVECLDQQIAVPGVGTVQYDIAFGGAYYAFVDADALGLSLDADNAREVIRVGQAIKLAVAEAYPLNHPEADDLGFLYGTIFTSGKVKEAHRHSRHVCIFADGELDRSPTGTGVSARIALLMARESIDLGDTVEIESIVGGRMQVTAMARQHYFGRDAVIPRVSGRAWITGEHRFFLDPRDPFDHGFFLR
ncbi:proline racemase family protein [Ferrimonas balearica]|uniref:proline racemase family protein n=1 Tax=Ferrimonas balearica TaxID=44012 RepID=UPI001C991428|nr:proline racemase family protein [Ferrimonas balearica]MBY5922329.1 proline racemase family protein [Ferrimonas balearica]MBY5994331.1 proline racemase family protein [Ferrimonas balearica]